MMISWYVNPLYDARGKVYKDFFVVANRLSTFAVLRVHSLDKTAARLTCYMHESVCLVADKGYYRAH